MGAQHVAVDTERSTSRVGRRAVVIGASMAGLCAARVLSERFGEVVVVDRDELPAAADHRRNVPQGRHAHLLLVSGARILAHRFPGILEDLRAEGAIEVDLCADLLWWQGGGWLRRPASDLVGPAMSRPLLERVVRRRVEDIANVVIRDRTPVDGLVIDSNDGRVRAVRLAEHETVTADLVVDASGRSARTVSWLEELGYEPPPVSRVEVDTRYVSRVLRRHGSPVRDWKGVGEIEHPATKRLAMLLPLEGDRWIVTVSGINGERPPTDPDALLSYLRSFGPQVIADVVAVSEPLSDVVTHRFPANLRRHVERLRRFPAGWVLLGDAVCSFDPIYGQGMTSAAMQAEALARQLDRAGAVDRRFARRYFRDVGRTVSVPWATAVGGDFAYEGTTGAKPFATGLLNRYVDRAVLASQRDDRLVIRMNEVMAMVRSPQALMTPAMVLRVLGSGRRSAVRATAPPASEPAAV
jgi:2-polyprenyl-6-methoxyphenol hydroxylase-like FAD-dependent oxidoreductase